ncbi:MAG: hypothetical protein Q7S55_05590 [Nanoarchaeota archaeon]|nr:hypothetical protein [Nanoarchaeota archaeon]
MEIKPFTSPIRTYIARQLQASFQFGKKYEEKEEKTFETTEARYEVRVVECYLTKEEKSSVDQSRPLEPRSDLFFSSSWFEVHDINDRDLDDFVENECVHDGNSEDTASYLLGLDDDHKHFSYCKKDWFSKPEIFDDIAYKYRSLNGVEIKSLDSLLKQKLGTLYRK